MNECHIKAAPIDSIKSIVSKLVDAADLAFKVGKYHCNERMKI